MVRLALLFVPCCVLVFVLFVLSWNSESAGFLSDDAVYLLMADAFSPYHRDGVALAGYILRQALFPPGYPMLLALLGAGSHALLWAHVITTAMLVLALAALGGLAWTDTRSLAVAVGLAFTFGVLPGTLFQNLELMSEAQFLLFSLLALWAAELTPRSTRSVGAAALAVACAAATRTAGLSLLLAFAIWLWRQRVPRRFAWLALASAPTVAWSFFKAASIPHAGGGYGQFWLWLADQFENHRIVDYVPAFVATQLRALWFGWVTNLDPQFGAAAQSMGALVLLLALPSAWHRLRNWHLDAWYLAIGLAVLLAYPFPHYSTRLVFPLIPVVLFHACATLCTDSARRIRVAGRPVLAVAVGAALALAILPSLGFIAHRMAQPVAPELAAFKHTRYWFRYESPQRMESEVRFRHELIQALRDVASTVPENDCLFAVNTGLPMLYAQRIVQQPPAPRVAAGEFARRSTACRYFLFLPIAGEIEGAGVPAYYPRNRLDSAVIDVAHVWEDPADANAPIAILARLRPPG